MSTNTNPSNPDIPNSRTTPELPDSLDEEVLLGQSGNKWYKYTDGECISGIKARSNAIFALENHC